MKFKKPKPKTLREVYYIAPDGKKREVESGALFMEVLTSIRRFRTKAKLTEEQLAQKTGIPVDMIKRIESGKRNVTIEKLLKIVAALGLVLSLQPQQENIDSAGTEVEKTLPDDVKELILKYKKKFPEVDYSEIIVGLIRNTGWNDELVVSVVDKNK